MPLGRRGSSRGDLVDDTRVWISQAGLLGVPRTVWEIVEDRKRDAILQAATDMKNGGSLQNTGTEPSDNEMPFSVVFLEYFVSPCLRRTNQYPKVSIKKLVDVMQMLANISVRSGNRTARIVKMAHRMTNQVACILRILEGSK